MTDQATRMVPAGWYEDPASVAHVRWWNGLAWTEHTTPKPTTPPVATSVGTVALNTGATALATATAERIAEVRELERQYGIGTAEHGVIVADSADDLQAGPVPEGYRPVWEQMEHGHRHSLRHATVSSWLIALWPVFTLVALIVAAYLYFYISHEPSIAGIPIALGIAIVPLLFTIIWAIADARRLRQFGHEPASAAFSLLGPLVYLIARRVRVRGSGPLVTLLLFTVLAVGAPFGAWATGAAAPVLTALTIQQTVSDALIESGAATSVTCPVFIDSTTPGTLYTCDAVRPDGTTQAVWVSIDTVDGDFSYALSLR